MEVIIIYDNDTDVKINSVENIKWGHMQVFYSNVKRKARQSVGIVGEEHRERIVIIQGKLQ